MKRMLVNATQNEETRVAWIDGKYLYNLDIEINRSKQKKSNIYKGIITRIEPSLEAIFIDYGFEKYGFLPFKEIYINNIENKISYKKKCKKIKNKFKIGEKIIVQISKEERGNKGAALTTFITLAGIYLILMPNNPEIIGISKNIKGKDRKKIKKISSVLNIPKNIGIIFRTASLGKSIEDLQLDLKYRLKIWKKIEKKKINNIAPSLIYQERDIIIRSFQDSMIDSIEEIIFDNPKLLNIAYKYIKSLGRSDLKKKIKLYTGSISLFNFYQIESQINSAFQRKVILPSGGSIILDTTEALTAIDINSSRSTKGVNLEDTAFNTNLEAVYEIVRQLKFRDLGGLIVIDFIDMNILKNQQKIEKELKKLVIKDRAKVQIGSISRFGLLEMSRQHLNSSFKEFSHYTCPRCKGIGNIRDNESFSLYILRLIEQELLKENTKEVHVIVPIQIACYLLNEKRDFIYKIEKKKIGKKTFIIPNKLMETPQYSIFQIKKGEEFQYKSYNLEELYKKNNYQKIYKHNFIKEKYSNFTIQHIYNNRYIILKNFLLQLKKIFLKTKKISNFNYINNNLNLLLSIKKSNLYIKKPKNILYKKKKINYYYENNTKKKLYFLNFYKYYFLEVQKIMEKQKNIIFIFAIFIKKFFLNFQFLKKHEKKTYIQIYKKNLRIINFFLKYYNKNIIFKYKIFLNIKKINIFLLKKYKKNTLIIKNLLIDKKKKKYDLQCFQKKIKINFSNKKNFYKKKLNHSFLLKKKIILCNKNFFYIYQYYNIKIKNLFLNINNIKIFFNLKYFIFIHYNLKFIIRKKNKNIVIFGFLKKNNILYNFKDKINFNKKNSIYTISLMIYKSNKNNKKINSCKIIYILKSAGVHAATEYSSFPASIPYY
ncbi:Rne/Rng family ribonuclease [Buchnera aphidicola (Kurisakia onigurumii)]|uniref:Rne/Rng family ribonuclease n=1 Tax=Buchnera aphidicola TaxID=9 RepID=UPI0031B6CF93